MDEEETKNCPNCKREIPAVNFTIHSVHCARNIRMCPVCKEPVPGAELDLHHKRFHKLLPCKQCGESVCGTDLEDHIRDSCANTIKTCRFCELELPRRELPTHEGYCGVRTEQCSECREWVMIKYRQLHLDSNHGFIRLDDDPAPVKKEPPKLNIRPALTRGVPQLAPAAPVVSGAPGVANVGANCSPRPNTVANARIPNNFENSGATPNSSPNGRPASIFDDAGPSNFRNDFPRTNIRYLGSSNSGSSASSTSGSPQDAVASGSRPVNGVKKRTNDQPQINTNKEVANKVDKVLGVSRGAVKKRPAPRPPRAAPPAPLRDLPYYSAMHRQQEEERDRTTQNEYNMAHGLPPVLNPAAKLEKLRKMDALHNRELEEYRPRKRSPARDEEERRRQEFKNLKPMSPEQFMSRFNEMQLRGDGGEGGRFQEISGDGGVGDRFREISGVGGVGDRFQEIKSSLTELRRGLNEVTAPYNNNNNNAAVNNNEGGPWPSPRGVELPCEFCNLLVPADDLVQHQTGCRPDLAQYWGEARAPAPAPPCAAPPPRGDPVIPCEFCAQSLPVYLITEHQERCAREVDILSAD